jgi:hypothetical protein
MLHRREIPPRIPSDGSGLRISKQFRIEFLRPHWIGLRVMCIAGRDNDRRTLIQPGQQQLKQQVVRQMVDGERGLKPILRPLVDIRKLYPRIQHQPIDQPVPKFLHDALRKLADAGKTGKVERQCLDC